MEHRDIADPSLAFRVLGPLEATHGGVVVRLGGGRQRAVLAFLVCEVGRTVTLDRLVHGIWGEPPPAAAVGTLQTYVFHLRQVLEPDRARGSHGGVLATVPGGYRLDVPRSSVDLARFEDGVVAGDAALERGDFTRASSEYGAALDLWRGEVLADLGDHEFVVPIRARLSELRLSALQSRLQAELSLGHHLAVVAELGALVAAHPLREGFHAQRILALYRCGRQSEALAAYRDLRELLISELGVEPSPPLRELNDRVLAHAPDLDWHPAGPSGVQMAAPTVGGTSAEPSPTPTGPAVPGRRLRTLAVVTVGIAALSSGSVGPLDHPAQSLAAVPANSVTELVGGSISSSVPVGTNPIALASAGGAMWVVNPSDDSVSVVDQATHAVRDKVPVGHDPRALAVTGEDLWVTNYSSGTVSRINVPARSVVDIIEVGNGPDAIAAGPAGLWVANSADNTIQRIDTTTGAARKPVDVGDGPDGLAVDDDSVWVANGRDGTVMRISGDGEPMQSSVRVGSGPRGIVVVGDDVWVANELSQSITRITIATQHTHTIDVGDGPTALAEHDGSLWVAERYAGDLVRLDPDTEDQETHDLQAPVRGLAVADGRLWIATGAFPATSHSGGTLRVAAVLLPGSFYGIDPARAYDLTVTPPLRVVYDGLLAYHYSGVDPQVLVPDLATTVPEPTDSGRTYTFNLRPGIRYSTGDEVRASDFALGVKRALLARTGRPDFYAGILGGRACIDHHSSCDLDQGVDVDDAAGRITFHLAAPDPQFLYKLTLLVVPAPPGTPTRGLTSPLPGTGPYRISSYAHDKTLTLDRNPYFDQWSAAAQPAGFLDRVSWVKTASVRAAADAVLSGAADLAELTPLGVQDPPAGPLVDALRLSTPGQLHRTVPPGTGFAVLNSAIPPFNSPLARRAFNYALDRHQLVALLGGPSVAQPTCQLMPPTMPSYQRYCPYSTGPSGGRYRGPDLERARALVRRSGTLGDPVTVLNVVGDYNGPGEGYFARVLRTLGYRVNYLRLPDTRKNQDWFYNPRNGVNVGAGGWIADFPLPSNFYEMLACDVEPGGYLFNYCNPGLDQRIVDATAALQTEPGAALRAWSAIDRAVTDQAPLVATANGVDWWISSQRVGNYQTGPQHIGPLLSQLWVR